MRVFIETKVIGRCILVIAHAAIHGRVLIKIFFRGGLLPRRAQFERFKRRVQVRGQIGARRRRRNGSIRLESSIFGFWLRFGVLLREIGVFVLLVRYLLKKATMTGRCGRVRGANNGYVKRATRRLLIKRTQR